MNEEVKIQLFLRELLDVCRRHKARIGGCGCCGSPFGELDGIDFSEFEMSETFDSASVMISGEKFFVEHAMPAE